MVELLSPAGSRESFICAVNAGASAVYLGLDLFSARKNAENFTKENLPFYVTYAHLLGVKVYVALNTITDDNELLGLLDYAKFCNDINVDGLIIQDMFLGKILHKSLPNIELHLSTQAGVNNLEGALLAKKYGFCRVVLARETPFSEIEQIAKVIDTEVFVQGALCTAFSGQCYMSSFAGNNSGNRGLCKQPCRKQYTLKNQNINVTGYNISLADLSLAPNLDKLLSAGVKSLKIEGRMRKPSYVYYATKYYSDILNGKSPAISPLSRTFKRGNYTLGLGFKQDKNLISNKVQSHVGEKIGTIKGVNKTTLSLSTNHKFTSGDSGKILRNGFEVGNFTYENGQVKYQGSPKTNDIVTITTDQQLESKIFDVKKTFNIDVRAKFLSGERAQICANVKGAQIVFESDFILEKAKNSPISSDDLQANLKKVGDYPIFANVSVETDGIFIAKSQLNGIRRQFYDKLIYELTGKFDRPSFDFELEKLIVTTQNKLAVIDEDFTDIYEKDFDIAIFAPNDYNDLAKFENFYNTLSLTKKLRFLYLPSMLNSADNGLIAPLLRFFDGVYVDGYYGIEFAKAHNKLLILGTGTNVYNEQDCVNAKRESYDYCLSKELVLQKAKSFDGFYYSAGSIKVMDLLYCPFNKTCNDCKGADYSTLDDGRKFILRRVKMTDCRFEVYNPYPLLTQGTTKQIFNFITLQKEQKLAILENANEPLKAKAYLPNYTTGHSKKPLL